MTSALLIRLGGLGDLLVALPALRLVRASFPDAVLHLLARKEYGGLLREAGVVDLIFSADDPKWMPLFDAEALARPAPGGGSGKAPGPAEFGRELPRYDWIAGWFHGGTAAAPGWRGGTGENAGALPLQAFRYDPASGAPISRWLFDATADFLGAAGRPGPPAGVGRDGRSLASFDDCRLLFSADATRRERFAVVHPGSGSPRKRWPLDRFRRVIEVLAERGLGGFLVTGEAESDLEEALGRFPLPRGWRRRVRPPLSDLARLLRAAAVYVGNDSGPTHLAAACGAETIAVFRREFAAAWAPFGRSTILSAPSVEDVAAADVLDAAAKVLKFPGPLC